MNLIESLVRKPPKAARHFDIINVPGLGYGALGYGQTLGLSQTLTTPSQVVGADFIGFTEGGYMSNPVIFAAERIRMAIFSEARLAFQRLRDNRPGDLFGTSELRVFERPWDGATTSDFLALSLLHADLAGNAYATKSGGQIRMFRPDWMKILLVATNGNPNDVRVGGYEYHHGGFGQSDPEMFTADEMMHFYPNPDPVFPFRGVSWITAAVRDLQSDSQATIHKQKFFENGATPNMVVKLDVSDEERFKAWVKVLEQNHRGFDNAYKTLYLAAGSDATVVGKDMQQVDFAAVQNAGVERILSAAGLHPAILGLAGGLEGASLNSGNFSAARRLAGDGTFRPLWRNFCGSAERLVRTPSDARLWYDDRDIPFLRDDTADAAAIRKEDALTIESLIRSGYTPDSARDAVINSDYSLLVHTGLVSVQLQVPGTSAAPDPAA